MTTSPHPRPAPAPQGIRHRRPGWRDPRILIGLLILAASILAGVKVLAAADNTVAVWAAAADLPAGTHPQAGDLARVQIRFGSAALAGAYLSAEQDLPADLNLLRPVGRGELIPRSALGTGATGLVRVPLAVEIDNAPADLARGDTVDVWVGAASTAVDVRGNKADLVLDNVVVLSAVTGQDTLAPSGTRQVIVGVDAGQAAGLDRALGQITSGRVLITGQD